ncbi:MAG: hypothetical protein HC884_06015 [Chloroflexaceae bacterium]|nr:hypothetical protein [Chloroflexaceae bacterium]
MDDPFPFLSWDRTAPPPVYVTTLGAFEVYIGLQPADWKCGTGTQQLRRMLSYLIARRGRPVQREVLTEIAGGRSDRPGHVVSNLLRLLKKQWGMEAALGERGQAILLLPHPTWKTDTDFLVDRYNQAQEALQREQYARSLTLLQQAETLCQGRYLPSYDARPDYSIEGERGSWCHMQKQVLEQQVRLCLELGEPSYHEQALRVVGRLIDFDPGNPASYELGAVVARCCHNETLAREYERKAREIEQEELFS